MNFLSNQARAVYERLGSFTALYDSINSKTTQPMRLHLHQKKKKKPRT